ncbi:MAG: LysE family translocator [Alphaproteobacteria bacterium]|nr:LysE family translocator [Alphaproteobacteria bacterium]
MDIVAILMGIGIAHILAVMSPGPSLVVVARTAVASSRGAGLLVAVGLGIGTLIWALAALFGLKALFTVAPWLYTGMKVAGALFLFYMAFMLIRHAKQPLKLDSRGGRHLGPLAAIRLGVLTQLANPKVAVFFGSIFITFLPADPSPLYYGLVLGLVFFNETAWYGFVAAAFASGPVRKRYDRVKATLDRITGAVLGGLGVKLLTT